MKNIKVSIIVPVYNAGLYLTPALQSVQNQTFEDWECICINDGSTDDSEQIIKEYVNGDSRFKL
ncbi:MAG: glycosyltransferase, partial [Alphaproteobacteria bacterium]|nr:glycosyltransferase [Alphaproteobacteria bacterium]